MILVMRGSYFLVLVLRVLVKDPLVVAAGIEDVGESYGVSDRGAHDEDAQSCLAPIACDALPLPGDFEESAGDAAVPNGRGDTAGGGIAGGALAEGARACDVPAGPKSVPARGCSWYEATFGDEADKSGGSQAVNAGSVGPERSGGALTLVAGLVGIKPDRSWVKDEGKGKQANIDTQTEAATTKGNGDLGGSLLAADLPRPPELSLGAVARAACSRYLMLLMVVALLELILVRGGMKR